MEFRRGFSNEKKVDDGFSRKFPLYERMLPRQNVSTEIKKKSFLLRKKTGLNFCLQLVFINVALDSFSLFWFGGAF